MNVVVYIDGFNLFYGALKGTPYKWLNVLELARNVLPSGCKVTGVKYFTARVLPRPNDSGKPLRQNIYLRALQTISAECIFGCYLSHIVSMPLANPIGQQRFVQVIKTEEKGSDVNIASHLLVDASRNAYDCALLVSGDSDLTTPVRMAIDVFGKTVGVLNPQKRECRTLKANASFYKHVRTANLVASQFPDVLSDAHGTFHKPQGW